MEQGQSPTLGRARMRETDSPPYHEHSCDGDDDAADRDHNNELEIVVGVSIRDAGSDRSPRRLPPVSVKVDRRSLNGSPVQVKIGVVGVNDASSK